MLHCTSTSQGLVGASGSASTVNLTGAPINLTYGINRLIGPVTGNIYQIGCVSSSDLTNVSIQVFNSNGIYLRGTTINTSTRNYSTEAYVTSDEVLAFGTEGSQSMYTSLDYGESWTFQYYTANVYSYNIEKGSCGKYLVIHYSHTSGSSSNRTIYFKTVIFGRSTSTWTEIVSVNVSTSGTTNDQAGMSVAFTDGDYYLTYANYWSKGYLIKLADRTYTSCSCSFMNVGGLYGVFYDDHIWFIQGDSIYKITTYGSVTSQKFKYLNASANLLSATIDKYSQTYRADNYNYYLFYLAKLSTTYSGSSSTTTNVIIVANLKESTIAIASLGVSYADFTVIGNTIYMRYANGTNWTITKCPISSLSFRIPTIDDPYVKTYIRT